MTASVLAVADAAMERERLYLHPGRSVVAMKPTVVTTILGSCISVCLWDEALRIGGITHYLLPAPIAGGGDAARFGSTAIPEVYEELRRRGATTIIAKVFGGSTMNSLMAATGADLGSQNVAAAMNALQTLGVPVAASDTGGSIGRKLLFQTDDGTAWVKFLEKR
ncbi:MAG: chemotaxis protein CheD [Acidobacteriota bacterium]|nr:chemotaxis protein CheD [Acidobacteriota bacterium]